MEDIIYFEVVPFVQDPPRPGAAHRTYNAFAVNTETGKMYYSLDCTELPNMDEDAPLYITYTPEDWNAFATALEDCSFTDWKDIGKSKYNASYHGWRIRIYYTDGTRENLYGSREKSSDKDIQQFDALWSHIQTFTATFPDRMEAPPATSPGTS